MFPPAVQQCMLPYAAQDVLALQISDVKRLLNNSRAEAVLLLTTSADKDADIQSHNFITSFETAYCFEPIAVKVTPQSQHCLLSCCDKSIHAWGHAHLLGWGRAIHSSIEAVP